MSMIYLERDGDIFIEIHNEIDSFSEEWDRLLPKGRKINQSSFLKVLEKGSIENYDQFYILIKDESGDIIGHVSAYKITTDLLIFSRSLMKNAAEWIRRFFPNFLNLSVLECGSPVSPGSPFAFKNGASFASLCEPVSRALENFAAKQKCAIVILRDFEKSEDKFKKPLIDQGFKELPNLPTTKLLVSWEDFDEYLSAMNYKSRQRITRGLRQAEESGLTLEVSCDFHDVYRDLFSQWRNVHDHAKEYTRECFTPAFFQKLSENQDIKTTLVKVMKEGKMLANLLLIEDGPVLRAMFFGRHTAGTRDHAYFMAMFGCIKHAIEKRFEYVELGLTTYTMKMEFGSSMSELSVFLKMRSRILQLILPKLIQALNPVPEIKNRRIFKKH